MLTLIGNEQLITLKTVPSKKWKAFKVHEHCMRGVKRTCRSANKCILNSLQKSV